MKHRVAKRHEHLQLDQVKLTRVQTVLGAKTEAEAEAEAIEHALALVVEEYRLDRPLKRAKGRMRLRKVFG
jgi:hypothetical protein